jgi:hypothetical protein
MIMSQYNITESPKQHHRVVEPYAKFTLRKTRLLLGRHTVESKTIREKKNNFSNKNLSRNFCSFAINQGASEHLPSHAAKTQISKA